MNGGIFYDTNQTFNNTPQKDYRILLENFSSTLNPGDKCALIGEEGNGKSTLLKLLYDPALVENYAEYEGELLRIGGAAGLPAQELPEQLRQLSIYEYLTETDSFMTSLPLSLPPCAAGSLLPDGAPLRR